VQTLVPPQVVAVAHPTATATARRRLRVGAWVPAGVAPPVTLRDNLSFKTFAIYFLITDFFGTNLSNFYKSVFSW